MQIFPFSDAVVDLLARPTVQMAYAVELDFRDGWVRAHTGFGPLVINGQTYEGVGSFGNVTPVREGLNSSSALSATLTLSGLDPSIIASALADRCRGRFGRLMIVAYDDNSDYAADVMISGFMDAPTMSYAGSEGENAISVTLTDRFVDWERVGTERWTDENQQSRHDGDRFFFAVGQMSDWPIYWGAKRDAPTFTYR
ncbi:hypothetical protein HW452_16585 [Halomonas aquamarina]|uniref:Uncharacterized protein n=1 Tax=Vreelandella aquamarina TaxID=77097 RepID=A0ACC5VXZ5_9GAMM|nr:hypothetical protein [Halomonas aquamarina]MBZ5489138.1 hypothetical protein [Halomonas aquamarina]